jgi:hypothetical protein
MSGHRSFSELAGGFSPERKEKVEKLTNRLREEMILQKIQEDSVDDHRDSNCIKNSSGCLAQTSDESTE